MSDPARPSSAAIRPEVWQAYLDTPEHMVAEILGGELFVMPRPRPRHASVASRLGWRLGPEVLSDNTRAIDRVKKQRIYHRAGVAYVWHIDPEARTFEIFRREAEHWALILEAANDEKVRGVPFETVQLDLGRLWAS